MKTTLVALNAHFMHTNLSLRQIMCMIPKELGEVEFVEAHINLPFWPLMTRIARTQADLIGISCYIWNIDYALKLVRALKRALPKCKIVLGGPEVEYRAELLLKEEPDVDFILCSEGEISFPALLKALHNSKGLGAVPGLCYRAGQQIVTVALPKQLPADRWPDVYAGGIAGIENRLLYIETSRGCPYKCQYCLSSAIQGVRALPADEAIRRLTDLAEQGATIIKLVDRTFNFDRKRAAEIWRGLIRHAERTGVRPTYHFEIAANLIADSDLELLAQAPEGLFQFEIGVQSSDQNVLENIERSVDFERVRRATLALSALKNIHLHVDLIAGLPEDTLEQFAQSINDVCAMNADMVQLGFLKMLHGSPMRARAQELGMVYQPDAPYEIISTPWMSFEQLCHLKDLENAIDWYYNSHKYSLILALLLQKCKPYDLFSELAAHMRGTGVFDVQRAEKFRAGVLLEYASQRVGQVWSQALVRHDLLSCGCRRDLPDVLSFEEGDELRAHLRQRFTRVRGQSAYSYPVDVLEFAISGKQEERTVTVLYDPDSGAIETV